MRSTRTIHVISAHAEGEVGDVIVGGVLPPPGNTIWEQSRWIARDGSLRNFVLNEPRGGVFRHVNLLVPPRHPDADAAFIIMEPEDTPPMSGSNSICVATVLLDGGLVEMQEPETRLVLEAPGGLVRVRAECRDGKARSHKARIKFNRIGDWLVIRVKTSRIGFAGNALLRRLRSHPEALFEFGEDAGMGRGIPIMLSTTDRMTYNAEGTELLLAWNLHIPVLSGEDKP